MNKMIVGIALMSAVLAGCDPEGLRDFPFEETAIVVGREVTAEFAAQELNAIVKKLAGREFMVEKWKGGEVEKCGTTPPLHHSATPPLHRIFIGRSPESERILGAEAFAQLGEEESCVFAKDGDLFLIGGDALGTLWAVYDFCEDNLGYRWYMQREDGEKIVKTDVVRYLGKPSRRQPKILGRRSNGWTPSVTNRLFNVRNRSNGAVEYFVTNFTYKYAGRIPGHGFRFFVPSGKRTAWDDWGIPKGVQLEYENFKKHPDWFSMMPDGKRSDDHQFCFASPGGRAAMTKAVLNWMAVKGPGMYQVAVNDARFGALCYCDGCKALAKKYNTNGGPIWDYMVELCKAVQKAHPEGGYYVQTLAYDGLDQTEKAPDNIVFPENFIADIAYIHISDRPIHDIPDKRAPEGEMVNYWTNTLKWASITAHRSYWFYGTDNPSMIYRRMQREMKEMLEAKIESPGACGTGGACEFHDLTKYYCLRLMYDPNCDIRAEVEASVRFKYGPAAPEILAYMDALELTAQKHIASSKGRVFECDPQYRGMTFLRGRDLADWQRLFAKAEAKLKNAGASGGIDERRMEFYRRNVRYAKIGLDLYTVLLANRIRKEVPDFAFDVKAVEAECRAIAEDYERRYQGYVPGKSKKHVNQALEMLDLATEDLAYYGNLKSEDLPPELAKYQASFVTRILPPLRKPHHWLKDRFTSEPDPDAACGYALVDTVPDKADLSKGLPYYIWDGTGGRALMPGKIALDKFKKDRYAMIRLGETTIPTTTSLIFAEIWGSPLTRDLLGRCHNPAAPNRRYEVWCEMKAEGPKFFPGDTRPNKLFIGQAFVVEIVGSGT